MKHILIIHPNLNGGGAERILIEYLTKFDLTQYNITLLLLKKAFLPHYLSAVPSQVRVLFASNSCKVNRWERMLYRLGWHERIEKKQLNNLKLGSYDAIISFMEGSSVRYHAHLMNHSIRNITWIHIDFVKNHWSKMFYKSHLQEYKIYNKMSDIIYVSQDAKVSFNQIFKINKAVNQEKILNPIDTERIIKQSNESDISKNKFTVIGVGNLKEVKRFDRFIDIAHLLINKKLDIEFWILGTGTLEANLKEKVGSLGLSGSIIFKGFVNNPYPYIRTADILLLTSDAEGYPTIVCESIVLGTPVVTTNVAGVNELLGNSEYGIIVEDMSAEAIAQKIEALYKNKDLLNSFVVKTRERAEIFDIEKTMDQVYQLLNK